MNTDRVLVFGSNSLGIHGAGAARLAKEKYGAQPGIGIGRTGMSYAIRTKKTPSIVERQLPLNYIKEEVIDFIEYANAHPEITFVITRIGCGHAGYFDGEVAPMFKEAPDNCEFDPKWVRFGLKAWTEAP